MIYTDKLHKALERATDLYLQHESVYISYLPIRWYSLERSRVIKLVHYLTCTRPYFERDLDPSLKRRRDYSLMLMTINLLLNHDRFTKYLVMTLQCYDWISLEHRLESLRIHQMTEDWIEDEEEEWPRPSFVTNDKTYRAMYSILRSKLHVFSRSNQVIINDYLRDSPGLDLSKLKGLFYFLDPTLG